MNGRKITGTHWHAILKSEYWYRDLKRFAERKSCFSSDVKETKSRLAWLDIALPLRSVESIAELFPKVFRMLPGRDGVCPADCALAESEFERGEDEKISVF